MSSRAIRILGIDPGLRRTGWGVIASEGNRLSFVACGIVRPGTELPLGERLAVIHAALTEIVAEHAPDEVAVEQTFVNKDAEATLKLGHARGIAMLVPAQAGLTIGEYAPNAVKKAVVGAGHADKKQIRMMISMLLPQSKVGSDDEADALAIAICHAHHRTTRARVEAFAT
ncbi:MAG: crossover junction endodeoxyribonuclease RuvC [Rhodobiaceae bacterium]|nr:crossover junction endodeoxyribonuclease RuvC [Rhodobiaceae bacterium]